MNKIKVKKSIIDVYDEQIKFLGFGSDLKMNEIFNKKLKILKQMELKMLIVFLNLYINLILFFPFNKKNIKKKYLYFINLFRKIE